MEAKTENTAVINATLQTASDKIRTQLTPKQYKNERSYRAAVAVFKSMREAGLISAEEYTLLDTIIAKKYDSFLSGLYR